jgi:hypothetical protein
LARKCFAQHVTPDPLLRLFKPLSGVDLSRQDLKQICDRIQPRHNQHVVWAVDVAGTIEVRVVNTDSWITSYRNPIAELNSTAVELLAAPCQLDTSELAA